MADWFNLYGQELILGVVAGYAIFGGVCISRRKKMKCYQWQVAWFTHSYYMAGYMAGGRACQEAGRNPKGDHLMICYRDRTYCVASNCTCPEDRRLTGEVKAAAELWWGGKDAPIAMAVLCQPAVTPNGEGK